MDAIVFDFDGVVVDSEPIHLMCFRHVLEPVGIKLSREDYYGKYLGYDDHDCFAAVSRDSGVPLSEPQIAELLAAKTEMVKRALSESIRPQAGAAELIQSVAAASVPLGICSGALRDEIALAAEAVGVLEHFMVVVAAQDVPRGKPDPAGYLLTMQRLAEATGRQLAADRCVAVEDAPAGIAAAKAAGMKVLAVTSSYPAEALHEADRIVNSLADVSVGDMETLID